MRMLSKYIVLVSILTFINSCSFRHITKKEILTEQNEGIVIAASFNSFTHSLLYLIPGIKVSIDDREIIEIPWTESKFIEITPNKHRIQFWYNWFGKAGESKGCFILEPHQIIYFEYHPPVWGIFSKPEIILIDNKTSATVNYDRNCGI